MNKPNALHNVYIARQPIYDRKMQVHAYELLFHDNPENTASYADPDLATSQLITNTLLEIGLESLVGDQQAFINATRNFILGENPLPINPGQVTFEIPHTLSIDKDIVSGVKKLAEEGYRIAVCNFKFNKDAIPLLEIADYIKIDIADIDESDLPGYVTQIRRYPAMLMAENVETNQAFDACKNAGFDLFQGQFLCKPRIISTQRIPSNRLAILKLLGEISNPVTDIHQLSESISRDVTLSYRLLRYINSVQFALRTKVDSIEQAVMLLGLDTVRNLANLLVLSGIDDNPPELVTTALVRAKMCELIAHHLHRPQPSMYFTAGLFSVIDAMMDQPMERILSLLPLTDIIVNALTYRTGDVGEVLTSVIGYERADWENTGYAALGINEYRDFYLQAIQWSDTATSTFNSHKAA